MKSTLFRAGMKSEQTWAGLANSEEFTKAKLQSVPVRSPYYRHALHLYREIQVNGRDEVFMQFTNSVVECVGDVHFGAGMRNWALPHHMVEFFKVALKPRQLAGYSLSPRPENILMDDIYNAMNEGYHGYDISHIDGKLAYEGIAVRGPRTFHHWYETLRASMKTSYLLEKHNMVVKFNTTEGAEDILVVGKGMIRIDQYLNTTATVGISADEVMAAVEATIVVDWDPTFDSIMYDWGRGAQGVYATVRPDAQTTYELARFMRELGIQSVSKSHLTMEDGSKMKLPKPRMMQTTTSSWGGTPYVKWVPKLSGANTTREPMLRLYLMASILGGKINMRAK